MADRYSICISSVTLYELLMGATNSTKRKDVKILIEDLNIFPLDEEVAEVAATIYHRLKSKNELIDFRDIFIGATCLTHNIPIKTLNKKHFSRIDQLEIE